MGGWIVAAGAAALVVVAYCFVRGLALEPNQLVIERHEIPLPGLPPALDGLEIVHISDLHLKGRVGPCERRLLEVVRQAEAPVLVITGDFLAEDRALANLVPMAMEMARGRQGFAVYGNSDHRPGRLRRLQNVLEGAGIVVLRNEAVTLSAREGGPRAGEGRLWLVGLDEAGGDRLAVEKAFRDVPAGDPGRGPIVVLAHSPDAAAEAARRGASLVLCGHTHGGQVNLPWFGPIWTNTRTGRPLARGLNRLGDTWVYTNRGVGTSILPLRLFCPPEVALLRLVRAQT